MLSGPGPWAVSPHTCTPLLPPGKQLAHEVSVVFAITWAQMVVLIFTLN